MRRQSAPAVSIRLLGKFQLSESGCEIKLDQSRLQELIAYLALHRHAPPSRQHMAFLLWPGSSEAQAHTNLRNLIFKLRKAWPNARHLLDVARTRLAWATHTVYQLDVADFEAWLARAEASDDPGQQEAHLQQAIACYRGDLLPECYDDWVLAERERLRGRFAQALAQIISLLDGQRRYDEAIAYAQRLLDHDPIHETAYRHLMQLQAATGDRVAALRTFHTCATILERELGVEPGVATREIYHRLLQLEETPAQPAPAMVARATPLVGRHSEWRQLQATWQQACQGCAQLVLLRGEAGIGKTRLAEELLDKVTHQGLAAVSTRAYAAEGALAYAPISDWLRQPWLRRRTHQVAPVWQVEIARLLPEILHEQPDLPAPGSLRESWQRQRFYEGLAQAFLAAPPPLLLHIDDLQWCDEETLTFLPYLLRSARRSPSPAGRPAGMLILGTLRPEEVGDDHPLTPILWSLRQESQLIEIELEPLSAADTAELASQIAGGALPGAVQERLYRESEGHPLFLVETVRARGNQVLDLEDASKDPVPQSPIPPKIQTVIRARLVQLSPAARDLANLAAVVGRAFTFSVLCAACDEPEETLVQALDELWQRRIVREQGEDAYDFSHDRIREVAYNEVSTLRRRLLHRRVGEALEQIHAGDLAPVYGQLATHFDRAGAGTKAQRYYRRAGEQAVAQYANAEAIHYLSRAWALTPPDHHLDRYEILLNREQVFDSLGQREAQHQDLDRLQSLADHLQHVHPQAQIEVAVRRAKYAYQTNDYQAAIHWAETAVRLAQSHGNICLEARALREWAYALWGQTDFLGARRQFERLEERARAAGLIALEAMAIEMIAATGMFSGMSMAEIRLRLQEALRLVEQIGDPEGMGRLYNKFGYISFSKGAAEEYDQALAYYAKGLAISRSLGKRNEEITILTNRGLMHVLQGNYRQAHCDLHKALRLSQDTTFRMREAISHHFLGVSLLQQGDFAPALDHLERAIVLLDTIQVQHFAVKARADRGLLHHLVGDDVTALTVLRETLTLAQQQHDTRGEAAVWTRLGYVWERTGAAAEAEQAYRKAQTLHCQMEQIHHSLYAAAGLARLALARGDKSAARPHIQQIRHFLQTHALEATVESTRVYLTCYQVFQHLGDPQAAAALAAIHEQLQRRAGTIDDPERRNRFWQVTDHKAIGAALSGADKSEPSSVII